MLRVALVGIILIFTGAFLAHEVQTGSGSIQIEDVRWQTADGDTLSALLYVPESASAETPAPGILAVHGYINSRETQSGFA
ncbi:MAG: dipeptidyl aminopeptidase/acylaminoacyl peptidase, partial [Candidatus Azotimanducaceae bacterium]